MINNFSKSPKVYLQDATNNTNDDKTELTLGLDQDSFLIIEKPTGQEPEVFKLQEQGDTILTKLSYKELINSKLNLSGNDLVLLRDDNDVVNLLTSNNYIIKDYLPTKSNLQTSDGVIVSYELLSGLIRMPKEVVAISEDIPSTSIGEVSTLEGKASIINSSSYKVAIKQFSIISTGDIIQTEANSSIEISFKDGTSFKLGSSAMLSVDDFEFDYQSGVGNIAISLFKGIFAFASGLVARDDPSNVKIKTPIAEIGLRGTKFAGDIDPNAKSSVTLIDGRAVVATTTGQYKLDEPWQTASDQEGSIELKEGSQADFLASYKDVFPQTEDLDEFVQKDYLSVIPKFFLDSNTDLKELVKNKANEETKQEIDEDNSTEGFESASFLFDNSAVQDTSDNNFADLLLKVKSENAKTLTYSAAIRSQFVKAVDSDPWLDWLFDANRNSIDYENIALAEIFLHTSTDSRIFGIAPEDYQLLPDTNTNSAIASLVNNYLITSVDKYYDIVTKLSPVFSSLTPRDQYYGQDSGFGLEFHLRNNDKAYGSQSYSDDYNLHLFLEDTNLALLSGEKSLSDEEVKAYSVAGNLVTEPNFKIIDEGVNNKLIFNFYVMNSKVINTSKEVKSIDLSREMSLFSNLDIDQFNQVVINLKFVTNAHKESAYKLKLDSNASSDSGNFFTKWMSKLEENANTNLTINQFSRESNSDFYHLVGSTNNTKNFISANFESFGVEVV